MHFNILNILTDKRRSPSSVSTHLPFIPDWQMGQMPIANHQCALACCKTYIQSARGRCCRCFPFISYKHQVKEAVLLPCLSCDRHGDWDTPAHLHCAEKVTIWVFKPACPKSHTKTAGKDQWWDFPTVWGDTFAYNVRRRADAGFLVALKVSCKKFNVRICVTAQDNWNFL